MSSEHTTAITVQAIYEAALSPAMWPIALQAIADCFGDVGALLIYSRDDSGFGYIESVGLQGLIERFFSIYQGEDLRAVRGVERGIFLARDAITDRHVVSDDEIESHSFYRALADLGLKYFATVPVCPDWRMNAGIAVQRSVGREPFTEEELDTLSMLGRHAEKAFRISSKLLDAELVKQGLGDALSRLQMGIYVLDSLRRVLYLNQRGEQLLGDGLFALADRFCFRSNIAQRSLDLALAGRLLNDPVLSAKAIRVEREHSDRPLTVYLLPLSPKSAEDGAFLSHARVLVAVNDPDTTDLPDPMLVRDLLGLTMGEAKLASLVGTGVRLRDAAEKLAIKEGSARIVLKRIFAKTNVSRQSELTQLFTRLMLLQVE